MPKHVNKVWSDFWARARSPHEVHMKIWRSELQRWRLSALGSCAIRTDTQTLLHHELPSELKLKPAGHEGIGPSRGIERQTGHSSIPSIESNTSVNSFWLESLADILVSLVTCQRSNFVWTNVKLVFMCNLCMSNSTLLLSYTLIISWSPDNQNPIVKP